MNQHGRIICALFFISSITFCNKVYAQKQGTLAPADSLKSLSLEELMNVEIEITSVSRRPEKLTEVPSAIQVITQEDIRNSGATNVMEALRLAPNLQVAQVNSSQWAISARGFNNVLANKLLVLIDGRTVYTPMYAGVFWDVQNLVLEDIERIEVISGPGGTLWGANAVNGVINIITKNSKDTKGFFAEAAAGTELLSLGSMRYGGKIGKNIYYRVYGTAFKRGNTILDSDSTDAYDAWTMGQGGFRFDWDVSEKDQLMLLGNAYDGRPDPDGNNYVIASGSNSVARWNHSFSERSDYQIQMYFDQTWRDFNNGFTESLRTYDFDGQHRFQIGKRNEIIWGAGARLIDHKVDTLLLFGFFPPRKLLHLYSAFVQDKFTLIPDRLSITVGSKFEHNNYTGFQYLPSGRVTWTPGNRHTVWAAVSRAVRNPSRIDREFYVDLFPGFTLIGGDTTFKSETMLAYEAGWRVQPMEKMLITLSGFFNTYDYLRSAEPGPPPFGYPIRFGNGVAGETYGAELAVSYQPTEWWSLRGGYTFLQKELRIKPGSNDANNATAESNDPAHQFLIQSTMRLPYRLELGTVVRYIDKLPEPLVYEYVGWDVRLGWKVNKVLELSVTGQNLLYDNHLEFIPSSPAARRIQRSVYGKIICRF